MSGDKVTMCAASPGSASAALPLLTRLGDTDHNWQNLINIDQNNAEFRVDKFKRFIALPTSVIRQSDVYPHIYPLGVMDTDAAWCILQCWNGKGIGNIGPIIDKLISLWPSK